jgi:predicted DNA-binding transcriptional regulator AlpA
VSRDFRPRGLRRLIGVFEHVSTVLAMNLLKVSDVCAELGISRSTWEKWRARRIGPAAIRLPNGELRIRRAELESWLLSCQVV